MSKVILVDPHISGHHLSYLRIYATAFAELGCDVSILTPEVQVLTAYLDGLSKEHDDRIQICELSRRNISCFESRNARKQGRINNLLKSWYSWLDFRDIARAIKKNHLDRQALVFILWLDSYISRYLPAFAVDAVLPAGFAGLYFHPGHLRYHKENSKFYRDLQFYLPLFRSRRLKFIGGFDDKLMKKLACCYRGVKFVTLPDIAEKHRPDLGSDLIQKILARAKNRKIISLIGSLDRRKNVWEFFEAARACTDEDLFFVCVGKLHAERFPAAQLAAIHEIVAKYPDRMFFHDGFVTSDQVFDAIFVISTAVFAVYKNFPSSSNMIIKSALYDTPIIVSDEHLMGEIVDEYNLGMAIDDVDPQTILMAINKIVYKKGITSFGFKRFTKTSSFDTLKTVLGKLL